MWLLGIYNSHDANAALYRDHELVAAVAEERVSRIKSDGFRFPSGAVAECLAIAGIRPQDVDVVAMPRCAYPATYYKTTLIERLGGGLGLGVDDREVVDLMARRRTRDVESTFDAGRYLADHGLSADVKRFFYNHHFSHALGALCHTDWDDALLWTADGSGDRVFYSAYRLHDGKLSELFGSDKETLGLVRPSSKDALGRLYALVTAALGFTPLRHEGKVLGLAAYGDPEAANAFLPLFKVGHDGRIHGTGTTKQMKQAVADLVAKASREDVAAAVQVTLEKVMLEAMGRLLERAPTRRLGLSGGVFANVKLTQRIAEAYDLDEIFVYPAMSDQGMAAGGVLQYLLERDGLDVLLANRKRFGTLYYGKLYDADAVFEAAGCKALARGDIAEKAAELIDGGAIIGTYLGRMEYGPRALGARTIMASPTDRTINDTLNKRLSRTEFMPFAPVVRQERVHDVFLLPTSLEYTARYMTATCDVRPEWRDKMQAIVHVDGTARPQIIASDDNPTYYGILESYEKRTGIPVLINTSFNVHEEPIINKPEEALRALTDGRVDLLVTETGIWARPD